MTSSDTGWRRVIVRWTAPKGFVAIILFLAIAILIEAVLVYLYQMFGLVDQNAWSAIFLIPGVNWSFEISISLLFHIVPLGVVLVLLTSWIYLTRNTAFVPKRVEQTRRVLPSTRRAQETKRLKSLRRFARRLSRGFRRIGRALKSGLRRIYGVSYISERLSFARAAVRSALAVLMIFLTAGALILLIEYPDLIHNWTLNLYRGNPDLRDFVLGVAQWLDGLGQAVPSLGGLGSAVINGMISAGPGFRQALYGAGAAVTTPIVGLDVAGKYVLAQNFVAWVCALVALMYVSYVSSRPSRRPRS